MGEAAGMANDSLFRNQIGVNMTNLMSDSSFESRIMRSVPQSGSSGTVGEARILDQSVEGAVASASSLDAFLAVRSCLQENLEKSTELTPLLSQLKPQVTHMSNTCSNISSNPVYGSTEGFGYQELPSNSKCSMDHFVCSSEQGRIIASRTGLQRLPHFGDPIPNGGLLTNTAEMNVNEHGKRSHELLLSLATSQPLLAIEMNGTDECSEVNYSNEALHRLNVTRSGLEMCSNRSFSAGSGTNIPAGFSQVILGSTYLSAVQEILAQIARFSLENVDQAHCTSAGIAAGVGKLPSKSGVLMDVNPELGIQMNSRIQSHAVHVNKTRLSTLLPLVDEQYNQCVDEMHTVVSAFYAATELDPPDSMLILHFKQSLTYTRAYERGLAVIFLLQGQILTPRPPNRRKILLNLRIYKSDGPFSS